MYAFATGVSTAMLSGIGVAIGIMVLMTSSALFYRSAMGGKKDFCRCWEVKTPAKNSPRHHVSILVRKRPGPFPRRCLIFFYELLVTWISRAPVLEIHFRPSQYPKIVFSQLGCPFLARRRRCGHQQAWISRWNSHLCRTHPLGTHGPEPLHGKLYQCGHTRTRKHDRRNAMECRKGCHIE